MLVEGWMFTALRSPGQVSPTRATPPGPEETLPRRPRAKERFIVWLVRLLMATAVVSLSAYVALSFRAAPAPKELLDLAKFSLTSLVGFLLGANKERP